MDIILTTNGEKKTCGEPYYHCKGSQLQLGLFCSGSVPVDMILSSVWDCFLFPFPRQAKSDHSALYNQSLPELSSYWGVFPVKDEELLIIELQKTIKTK